MQGLSGDIKLALDTVIEGLKHKFEEADLGNPEKMQIIMRSKVSSFNAAKKIILTWVESPNAPSNTTLRYYVTSIVKAGSKALVSLRLALRGEIDYSDLEPEKHSQAILAKQYVLNAVIELDKSILELRNKLEDGDLDLTVKEFIVGYPENFAKNKKYDVKNYFKNWHNKETDGVNICPFSTKGKTILLQDLHITLPKEPIDKTEILFHSVSKENQYWRRQDVPPNITPNNVGVWDKYIREEFRRRREGIWFYNHGEAVYLTGNHYFSLQWCKMLDDGGYMDFRYAQLNMYYHIQACIVDSRCLGQIFVKARRTGFTYAILGTMINLSTTTENAKYGMTSKGSDDVEEVFKKLTYMFLSLPFYFRPVVRGKEDSPSELLFGKPSNNTKQAKITRKTGIMDYLNTSVDHRPSKNDSYDSVKLNMYLGDECSKWLKPGDYVNHLGQVSPTMMPSGKVVGKAFLGSTMGEKNKGGSQFIELIRGSMVKDRDIITKKTPTALYMYFLAAQDNMEAYTDKYGICHKVAPKSEVYNTVGDLITGGSEEYLIATEDQKEKQSDKAYNEQLRTYPRTLDHALRDESNNCIFNYTKLYAQMEYNNTQPEESLYTKGNFKWKNGIVDNDVEFYPDKDGRFYVAWMPSQVDDTLSLRNNVKEVGEQYSPLNLNLVRFGNDPFSLKSTHGEGSKGAMLGKTTMFPEGGAPANTFVLEYICRPQDETIFFEDVIMACRFYGSPVLVESNRVDLLRHMASRGYRKFATDRLDRPFQKLNTNEIAYGGQMMASKSIIDGHINVIGLWIEQYCGVYTDQEKEIRVLGEIGDMPFNRTLEDLVKFNPNRRSDHDAMIAAGLCLMACNPERYRKGPVKSKRIDIKTILRKYENK